MLQHGGYTAVTTGRNWRSICRALGIDPKAHSSATFNMRVAYERLLLDWEHALLAAGEKQLLRQLPIGQQQQLRAKQPQQQQQQQQGVQQGAQQRGAPQLVRVWG